MSLFFFFFKKKFFLPSWFILEGLKFFLETGIKTIPSLFDYITIMPSLVGCITTTLSLVGCIVTFPSLVGCILLWSIATFPSLVGCIWLHCIPTIFSLVCCIVIIRSPKTWFSGFSVDTFSSVCWHGTMPLNNWDSYKAGCLQAV